MTIIKVRCLNEKGESSEAVLVFEKGEVPHSYGFI